MFIMNAFTNNRKNMSEKLNMFGDTNEGMNEVVTEEVPQSDLCKEMMENYALMTPKYLHDTSPNEVEKDTVEEVVVDITSFDGNDSMWFSEERKAAFAEYYRLERLCYENEKEFYIAPNKAVVYFYELGPAYKLCLLSNTTTTAMEDVVELLTKSEVNTDFENLLRMMQRCHLFPGDETDWENMRDLASHFGKTCITDDLHEYVGRKFIEEVEKCKFVKLPEIGMLVHRINIEGDRSFSKNPLRVLSFNTTYVTLEDQDTSKIDFDTSLANFWDNFEPIGRLTFNAAHLLQDALWLLLDEELIQNLENGIYTEREPKAIQVNEMGMYIFIEDGLTLTISPGAYSLITISLQESTSNSTWMVGSPLDLPLVLNEFMKEESDTVKTIIQDRINEYCGLVVNTAQEFCHYFGDLEELNYLNNRIVTNLNRVQAIVDRL